jgi:hypothetical protein
MHKTIIVTNKVKQIMYSTQTPPFIRVVLRPPPFPYRVILANIFVCFQVMTEINAL